MLLAGWVVIISSGPGLLAMLPGFMLRLFLKKPSKYINPFLTSIVLQYNYN